MKEMICKLSVSLLSLHTVTHSYDTSAVLPKILWLKTDRILDVVLKSVQFCCVLLDTVRELHEQELLWFGKKCESASDKLHDAL
jgi:hypothetical protein